MKRIAVIDDENSCLLISKRLISELGHQADTFLGYEKFSSHLISTGKKPSELYDLIISDVRMPNVSGLDVLKKLKKIDPHCNILLMTSFTEQEKALEALEAGALDYIPKPFSTPEVFNMVVNKWLHLTRGRNKKSQVKSEDYYIEQSESLKSVVRIVDKVALTSVSIYIHGETGTGKEIIAKYIHQKSGVAGPFVVINCAAIPKDLIESELFGHEKGAFTGAIAQKIGLIEKANNGTLFLDEIGDMDLSLQTRLLRVLQSHKLIRVGGNKEINVNARIISATHHSLSDLVKGGTFREDLFYRLNVIGINLPALRERADIKAIADFILQKINRKHNRQIQFSPDIESKLKKHRWPGNLRELENTIERELLLSEDGDVLSKLDFERDPLSDEKSDSAINKPSYFYFKKGGSLKDLELQYIFSTLKENSYNKTATAKVLGVSLRTLYRKLDENDFKVDVSHIKKHNSEPQLNFLSPS